MAVSKKKSLVGLDIGSHCIKLVEIEHTKHGRVLRNFGVAATPPNAIVEGSVKDVEAVSAAIKSLFRNLKVRNSNVAVSLSGYSVIAKKIALDRMEESQIEKAIQEEAEKYIPYDISEVNLDFAMVNSKSEAEEVTEGEGESAGPERMEMMLVAAKREIIDEYVELVRAADLNPGVLDVDIFALQNAVEISWEGSEECFAIVNLGAKELEINAISGGVSTFSRDSSYGGAQITEAIMSEFGIDFQEAEKLKLGGIELAEKKRERLEKIVTRTVSAWVGEIKRALDFVASTRSDDAIGKIIVSGGSSRIPGFQKYLEMETRISVEALDPFKSLVIDSKRVDPDYLNYMAPQAGVAVGLALRYIDDK
ncbi:MAG: pilus assembly protein PilM [Proteobacteria bacterium]|nr:pilus assembly protein PilM [Pseudomonadota bacterium]